MTRNSPSIPGGNLDAVTMPAGSTDETHLSKSDSALIKRMFDTLARWDGDLPHFSDRDVDRLGELAGYPLLDDTPVEPAHVAAERTCVWCEQPLPPHEPYFHPGCDDAAIRYAEALCPHCGESNENHTEACMG